MHVVRTPLVVLAVAFVLGGASPGAGEKPKEEWLCVNRREINTIRVLDGQHALVNLSSSRHYMFTLDKSCLGFADARKVAISQGTGRVCGDGLTLVTFETPMVGPMRCRIEGIDAVVDEDAARELIKSRRPPE